MKDRIGNTLALRDKVLVQLSDASIIGFVAEVKECGLVALRRGTEAGATPGHVLVSCVIAIPVEPSLGAAAQLVKVYDAEKAHSASLESQGTSEPSTLN